MKQILILFLSWLLCFQTMAMPEIFKQSGTTIQPTANMPTDVKLQVPVIKTTSKLTTSHPCTDMTSVEKVAAGLAGKVDIGDCVHDTTLGIWQKYDGSKWIELDNRSDILFSNGDFEQGLLGWTGALLELEETAPLFGKKSGKFDFTALNDSFEYDLTATTMGYNNGTGEIKFKYCGGDTNIKAEIIDGLGVIKGTYLFAANPQCLPQSFTFYTATMDEYNVNPLKASYKLKVYQHTSTNATAVTKFEVTESYADAKYLSTTVVNGEIGEYVDTANGVCPEGTIAADGSLVSRVTYANLFAKIGTTYGVGDGSTTFGLPDGRAAVRVGSGTSTKFTQNSTKSLGTYYNDQIQSHNHTAPYAHNDSGDGAGYALINVPTFVGQAPLVDSSIVTDGIGGTPRTGTETRPNEYAATTCIRYKQETAQAITTMPSATDIDNCSKLFVDTGTGVVTEDEDNIVNSPCTVQSTGRVQCTYKKTYSIAPKVGITTGATNVDNGNFPSLISQSTTNFIFQTYQASATPRASGSNVTICRSGTDRKFPTKTVLLERATDAPDGAFLSSTAQTSGGFLLSSTASKFKFTSSSDATLNTFGSLELNGLASGNRESRVDFHADDTNTDYSARMIRTSGVNGNLTLSNVGTGSTTFGQNGYDAIAIDSVGTVEIFDQRASDGGWGAVIRMRSNNNTNTYDFTISPTNWFSMNGTGLSVPNGPIYAGGTGGNVPHDCIIRTASATSYEVTSSCSAGEKVTGGGCDFSAAAADVHDDMPAAGLSGWGCGSTASQSMTAYAVCCQQ